MDRVWNPPPPPKKNTKFAKLDIHIELKKLNTAKIANEDYLKVNPSDIEKKQKLEDIL